jgi:hypothetical protein
LRFDAFLQSLANPSLRQIAMQWNEARGTRRMPGWSDLKPAGMAAQLPIVWAYRYDPATDVFTGRLAGDKIARLFDRNFRGALLQELQPAEVFEWIHKQCKRVVTEPALYRSEGMVFSHMDRFGYGERIMMPLSDDGITIDGIMGGTEYRVEMHDSAARKPVSGQAEGWFSLAA